MYLTALLNGQEAPKNLPEFFAKAETEPLLEWLPNALEIKNLSPDVVDLLRELGSEGKSAR